MEGNSMARQRVGRASNARRHQSPAQATPASEPPAHRRHGARPSKSGVSLVIVLGILLLISLAVLSFVRVTSDSRDTSRLAAERLKAEQLARTALVRAMEDVNTRMAGSLFYWKLDDAASDNFIVSTNGPAGVTCNLVTSMVALAEMPGVLTNEAIQVATNCHWMPMLAGTATVGRCAYLIANISGFLDANSVGGIPASNRIAASELDLSPLFYAAPDVEAFLSDRTNHIRYETREELFRLNTGITNCAEDVFTVFSYDPNPDVYFSGTNGIGTRLFAASLQPRTCVTNIAYTNLVAILANSVTDPGFVVDCILDYQDGDRFLGTNNFVLVTNRITEAVPLLNEVHITTNSSPSNLLVNMEFWYPFFPPPAPDEEFRATVYGRSDLGPITPTNFALTDFDFTHFAVCPIDMPCSPGSNFTMEVALQWKDSVRAWTTIQSYILETNATRNYSLNDPRLIVAEDLENTIGTTNANCRPWGPGCQGLPIYHPNRPMRNIGELGYVWTGEPWRTLDLTRTNEAALVDRLTVRSVPGPRRGMVNAGATQTSVWDTVFYAIPMGITTSAVSTCIILTNMNDILNLHRPLRSSARMPTLGALLADVGTNDFYVNSFLTNIPSVNADLKEDVLRGIVELVSFRHQLYLVVLAAQPLAADGRTPTAERRAMALVWRDGYTGQYFVRNFRWIAE